MGCCGGKGRPVRIVYMHGDLRKEMVACTHCDQVDEWPVFTRSAHGGV